MIHTRRERSVEELDDPNFDASKDIVVTAGSIHFDDKPKNADVKYGSFKIAQIAHIVSGTPFLRPLQPDQTTLCLKRVFMMQEDKRVLLDAGGQVQKVSSELNTKCWAEAIHNRSVDDLRRFHSRGFENIIEKFAAVRFVGAALARLTPGPNVKVPGYSVFMIEEYISRADQGNFRKYLDNRTGALPTDLSERDRDMADYLSCLQHVQYLSSDCSLFVADYQGGSYSVLHWGSLSS